MQVNKKRILIISGWVLLGIFVLGAIGAGIVYNKREALLKEGLAKAIRKAKRDYNLNVTIGKAQFTGLSTVAFSNITVVPEGRDSLLRVGNTEVGVSIWPLLYGQVAVSSLTLQNGLAHIVRRDSTTNIDFLLKSQKKDSTATNADNTDADDRRVDLAVVAEKLVDNLLAKIPDNMDIRNLELRLTDNDRQIRFLTETATIDDDELTSTIHVNGDESVWHLTGTVDPSDQEANVALYADGKPLELPYLEQRYKLKLQADTLRAELRDVASSGGEFKIEGAGAVRNLRIHHPAVALGDVVVESAAMDANLFVGENYVGIDSTSTIYLGKVKARPFIKYTVSPVKIYDVQIHTDPLDAQDLFDSFPQGLFESLEGMKVAGKLKYDAVLHLDSSLPDSVQFNSGLTPDQFKILQFGKEDFSRVNKPFEHEVYEKDKLVRKFIVGPANPDFAPLNSISPNLRNAILTAEDYNFFTHHGFNEKAFRVSIATNFKTKKFKRGGSTISMQFVKNAFLNRNKTLSRKAEEILIVWLIENQHIISKERMYEIYLNFIEWGRNIYGIGEASRYYFAKSPANLDIGESILLSYVVPSPKATLSRFYPDGSVKTYLRGYFKLIGRIMASRGLTPYDTTAYGFYGVRLREGLRREIAPVDSIEIDSLMMPDEQTDETSNGINDFFRRVLGRDREEPEVVTPEQEAAKGVVTPTDSVPKSRRQLRKERREQRRREKEQKENESSQ
ncbi:biosynthetic peptidoglycan transglycosylase [Larkinella knui]|uniref:Penicillin-binding protein n=1 Tax=Larkinella knui TaxID=2025310 RepID=A0A3P1CW20_9BACT|nr:biosynthetic peptidoglycan transglycosylase [Larkinella knui]RRB17521.1 penicillin-binding protein [Larkinella knui]